MEVAYGAETHSVNKDFLMFSAEVTLNLIEDRLALCLGGLKFTELEGLARAPEESTLRELIVTMAVHANGDVVVGIET